MGLQDAREGLVDQQDADTERQHQEQEVVPEHRLHLEHIHPELQGTEDLGEKGAHDERDDRREQPSYRLRGYKGAPR